MNKPVSPFPSVDEVLRSDAGRVLVARHGHAATLAAVRSAFEDLRAARAQGHTPVGDRAVIVTALASAAAGRLAAAETPRLRRVYNLTGTVLHTNLGRALLPEEAIAAACDAMRSPAALEFDLETGRRGERDDAVRGCSSS